MKKIFSKVLGCALATTIALSTLSGCGSANNWEKPTLKTWGEAKRSYPFPQRNHRLIYL